MMEFDVDHGPGNSSFEYLLALSRPRVGENLPIACLQTRNPFSFQCGVMFKKNRDLCFEKSGYISRRNTGEGMGRDDEESFVL